MDAGLTLTKQGLIKCEWNGDRCGEHKRRKKDGKCVIVNRESGEIVFTANTPEDADDFFYDIGPVNNVFTSLRDRIQIEEGFTLRDLMDFIKNTEELELLALAMLPLFDYQRQKEEPESTTNGPLIISREGLVGLDGMLTIVSNNSFTIPHADWDVPLKLDEEFKIYDDGKVVLQGTYCFTLLEMLESLFGRHPDDVEEIYLKKDGVFNAIGEKLDPLQYLMSPCSIAENFSLRDLFNFVDSNEALKCLIAQYSWCRSIDEFHAAAKLPATPTTLYFLKLTRRGEVHVYKEDRDIGMGCDIHGYGPLSEEEKAEWVKYGVKDKDGNPVPSPETQHYGIGFTPMCELADLSIVADDTLDVYEHFENKISIGKQHFTLLEILDTVYWEVSFYGGPEQAQEMCEDLKQRVEDVKSGVEKTIPWEEAKEDIEKETSYEKEVEPNRYTSVDEMFEKFDEEADYKIDVADPRDD